MTGRKTRGLERRRNTNSDTRSETTSYRGSSRSRGGGDCGLVLRVSQRDQVPGGRTTPDLARRGQARPPPLIDQEELATADAGQGLLNGAPRRLRGRRRPVPR